MRNFKSITYVFIAACLLMSCGKKDEDNGSDDNNSHLSSLSSLGIEITSEYSEHSTYQKNYYAGDGSGYVSIKCINKDDDNVNNFKRAGQLQELLTTVNRDGYLKIDGKRYNGNTIAQMVQQSINILGSSNSYSNYGNYNNNCPRDLLSQYQVEAFND